MKEAILWEVLDKEKKSVKCKLCNWRCSISEGMRGVCHVRENRDGKLYSLVYGKAVSYNVDKIEKKPFFHYKPGSDVFSFATVGCNFNCLHCQNYDISQPSGIFGEDKTPEEMVALALKMKSQGIAYTYTEPTIFMEYALDVAELALNVKLDRTKGIAHKKKEDGKSTQNVDDIEKEKEEYGANAEGLFNVFVTNGYMTPEAIKLMEGRIQASRIDLKAFNEKFYLEVCGGIKLEHVLESIKLLYKAQEHIEIITLIIPGLNDSEGELEQLAQWIADLDENIPLHFSSYYPANKMNVPPTRVEDLESAYDIAKKHLNYVYLGNVPGHKYENTFCHNCGEMLVQRYGFTIMKNRIDKGRCFNCGKSIPGVWE